MYRQSRVVLDILTFGERFYIRLLAMFFPLFHPYYSPFFCRRTANMYLMSSGERSLNSILPNV